MAVVFAFLVYGRPHRHHQLYAHFMQLVRHFLWILPVTRIEFIVALLRPVEIVYDDNRQRNSKLLVFFSHGQNLVLRFITQPALPEACRPMGHFRRVTCEIGKRFAYLARIAAYYDIIYLTRRVACEAGAVVCKLAYAG